jgi:hypothetical protein
MATQPGPAVSSSPKGEAIALLVALSNPSNHDRHTAALTARDNALNSSSQSYSELVVNLARIMRCAAIENIAQEEMAHFNNADPTSVLQLMHDPKSWNYLRCMAGLLLKNALLRPPNLSPTELDPAEAPQRQFMTVTSDAYAKEIQLTLVECLVDPKDVQIRKITSSIVASCSGDALSSTTNILNLCRWPELMPFLLECLNGSYHGEIGVSAALDTLVKLCEDAPVLLDSEAVHPSRPVSHLMPIWIKYLDLPQPKLRENALRCINSFIESMPSALTLQFSQYLQGLSKLATDPSPKVRILVCQAIVSLTSSRIEYIAPHFASIVEFMVHATSDASPDVTLEACEFWLTFASLDEEVCNRDMMAAVQNALPTLIPKLVTNMVYSPEKQEELLEENRADEAGMEDRQQDLAPVFHKNRNAHGASSAENGGESDEEEEQGDDALEWSLRKCAAASLDTLSSVFGPEVMLPPLLPTLQEGLNHPDQWVSEASILALGAIAEGCLDAMTEHLPSLHSFLLQQLAPDRPNTLPQLKSITCWTLSRYASWMVEQVESGAQPGLTQQICELSAQLMLDRNKKVQIASCSSLGVYVEHFGMHFIPFLEPLFQHFAEAMKLYKTRSFMVLCDTLGVLADVMGEAIGEGSLPHLYVTPLVQIWTHSVNPLDRVLLPLMECLACISSALGSNFQPWALVIFEKCMSAIEACVLSMAANSAEGDAKQQDEESDCMICATDLLDGMVEGLGANFEALVKSSTKYADHFLQVVHALCTSEVVGVRMSAFALVGDLGRNTPALLEPGIGLIITETIRCIDPVHPSVCNNATWAMGEICVRFGSENSNILAPYVESLLGQLIPLLVGNQDGSGGGASAIPGLPENASSTMGRLARINPNFVSRDLPRFVPGWCEGLARIADMTERNEAFEGLLVAIHSNPTAIISAGNQTASVAAFIFAIVSWHIPTGEDGVKSITSQVLHGEYSFEPFPPGSARIGEALGQILREMRKALGDNWNEVSRMPVNVRRLLADVYQV